MNTPAGGASFTGAWIETPMRGSWPQESRCRLLHGGVDRNICTTMAEDGGATSPPSRGRGSKPSGLKRKGAKGEVASFTGAWIETACRYGAVSLARVASFTGAWIETCIRAR